MQARQKKDGSHVNNDKNIQVVCMTVYTTTNSYWPQHWHGQWAIKARHKHFSFYNIRYYNRILGGYGGYEHDQLYENMARSQEYGWTNMRHDWKCF